MEIVKKTDKYTIFKKKTGRYSVKDDSKKYMNGEEKIKILVEEGLIKISPKKVGVVKIGGQAEKLSKIQCFCCI